MWWLSAFGWDNWLAWRQCGFVTSSHVGINWYLIMDLAGCCRARLPGSRSLTIELCYFSSDPCWACCLGTLLYLHAECMTQTLWLNDLQHVCPKMARWVVSSIYPMLLLWTKLNSHHSIHFWMCLYTMRHHMVLDITFLSPVSRELTYLSMLYNRTLPFAAGIQEKCNRT